MSEVDISVVIPTKGRGEQIIAAIGSVDSQTCKVREIIVIDGSAASSSRRFERSSSLDLGLIPVTYIHAPQDHGLTAARNRGVRHSKSSLIMFLDDDAVLDKCFVEVLSKALQSCDVGGASGIVVEPLRKGQCLRRFLFRFFYTGALRQLREEVFLKPVNTIFDTNTLPGVSCYRADVFRSFEFDENLRGPCVGEDIDFSYRVGREWRLIIDPKAIVYHYPSKEARISVRNTFCSKVLFYRYHFTKNIPRSFSTRLAYTWLNCGFIMHAVTSLDWRAVLGVLEAWFIITFRRKGPLSIQ